MKYYYFKFVKYTINYNKINIKKLWYINYYINVYLLYHKCYGLFLSKYSYET